MLYTAPAPIRSMLPSLFLAGGITDCPDWQQEILLDVDTGMFNVYNPRRTGALARDDAEADRQIRWEYAALRMATVVLFWFPRESTCPVALLEYGAALERNVRGEQGLMVGCHGQYGRRFDVEVQSRAICEAWGHSTFPIYHDFDALRAVVRQRFGKRGE